MSDDVKDSWKALGDQMSALGSLVRQRINEMPDGADEADQSQSQAIASGSTVEHGATHEIKAALDRVVAATRELGERIGEASRDDEIKANAKETMGSLDSALRATVDFIAAEVDNVVDNVVKPAKRSGED